MVVMTRVPSECIPGGGVACHDHSDDEHGNNHDACYGNTTPQQLQLKPDDNYNAEAEMELGTRSW